MMTTMMMMMRVRRMKMNERRADKSFFSVVRAQYAPSLWPRFQNMDMSYPICGSHTTTNNNLIAGSSVQEDQK